jgi:Transposase
MEARQALLLPDEGDARHVQIENTAEALHDWVLKLIEEFGARGNIYVATEKARGALLYTLMQYPQLTLFPLNSKATGKLREALRAGGAKNDRWDCRLQAELVKHFHYLLPVWRPDDVLTRKLAALCEGRRKAVNTRTRLGQEIKAQLKASFPFALELLEGDCQSLLAADFLSKWPDLASLQRAGAATIRRFFYARNSRRMDRIELLLVKLKTTKPLTTDEAVIIPSALVLRTLAAQLRALLPFLAEYDKVLRSTFDQHPDAEPFRSVPGAGEVMAPRLLTAFGTDRARFANAEAVSKRGWISSQGSPCCLLRIRSREGAWWHLNAELAHGLVKPAPGVSNGDLPSRGASGGTVMSTIPIEADYLVIGAGATAMAFVDTLLSENTDATAVMVDRQHRPGGHWNNAYPFVRLHQPSEYYGVASRELSDGIKDTIGFNAGMYGLASGAQVLAYFDQVMQQRFLTSGRVRWFAMSEYAIGPDGKHQVRSLTSGNSRQITVRKKVVDATHAHTAVPSTHPPKYAVAPGVRCVPLNQLPQINRPHTAYTVVGSGKTGMDAILWLLENGVPSSSIRWVMPRDAWLLNRANIQPGVENFERSFGANLAQFDAILEAESIPDLFARLEARELLLRIDKSVLPTAYRCAVVSKNELTQLRRVEDIVRLGHVRNLEPTQIVLDKGPVPAVADTLYIDCSASALRQLPAVPVFDKDRINLLTVRTCQPVQRRAGCLCGKPHYRPAAAERDVRRGAQPGIPD